MRKKICFDKDIKSRKKKYYYKNKNYGDNDKSNFFRGEMIYYLLFITYIYIHNK